MGDMFLKQTATLALALLALLIVPNSSNADIIWDWSFSNTSGQFVTDGIDHSAGVYTLLDFSVFESDLGASIGSLLGGNYASDDLGTVTPYTMDWNGSAVTQWNHSGSNLFDWWLFADVANPDSWILFGWETGNINTVDQGAYAVGLDLDQDSFLLSVAPAMSILEPGTLFLLGAGLTGLGLARRHSGGGA